MKNGFEICLILFMILITSDLILVLSMGVCQSNPNPSNDTQFSNINVVPNLHSNIEQYLASKKPFEHQLAENKNIVKRQYQNFVYEGPVNILSKPSGIGKLYRSDGSLYVGEFKGGVAEGKCHFIRPDGSYYVGEVKNGKAEGKNGLYQTANFKYQGQFQNNNFHGQGRQTGADYVFQGKYVKGKKSEGKLDWGKYPHSYEYTGSFDENDLFTGKVGSLKEPTGEYKGYFLNGDKHGKGVYKYISQIKYEGDYIGGKKNGFGILYNRDGTISYEGEFRNGLPHGTGTAVTPTGHRVSSQWIEGLDKRAHEELQSSQVK